MLLLSRLELALVLVDSCCLQSGEELYGCQAGCYEQWSLINLESAIHDLYC